MAQTNVIVSYAPTRRAAANERPVDNGERRWSAALVGALLAGGAVFAFGHFVASDGSLRESGIPARPLSPLVNIEPAETVPITERMGQRRSLITENEQLPYLALVRDIASAPRAAPAVHKMAASVPREPARAPRDVPFVAASREPVANSAPIANTAPFENAAPVATESPKLAVDLAAQPTPPPVVGLRRDLEGFLQAQGHELVAADAAGTLVEAEIELTAQPTALADVAIVPPVDAGLGDASEPSALAAVVQPDPQPRLAVIPAIATTNVAASETAQHPEPVHAQPSRLTTTQNSVPTGAAPADQLYLQSYPLAVVNGEPLGAITLRDVSAGEPTIHLGALVGLLRLRMPEAEFTRLSGAAAADRFVSLDELRAAGITVQFDAREDRLLIDAR